MKNKKNTKDIKQRSVAILAAKSRNSAGFMGDRRKKRSKEHANHNDGW